jgi:hypothetical protein
MQFYGSNGHRILVIKVMGSFYLNLSLAACVISSHFISLGHGFVLGIMFGVHNLLRIGLAEGETMVREVPGEIK